MEFKKCSRCGNFYVSESNVCPKCIVKDNMEFSAFKAYVEENGLEGGVEGISGQTGISVKNINRFLGYQGISNITNETEIINKNKSNMPKHMSDQIGTIYNT